MILLQQGKTSKIRLIGITLVVQVFFMMATQVAIAQEEMPVIVNEETGEQVVLTPAYWDANVDIANRSISCDGFIINAETSTYLPVEPYIGHPRRDFYLRSHSEAFTHHSLTEQFGYNYVDHRYIGSFRTPKWRVTDGIYDGIANISMGRYIELVSYDNTTLAINQQSDKNAIRVWHSAEQVSVSAYSVCYDDDGAPFIPTGSADTGNTNLVDLNEVNDFSFQFPEPVDADFEVPVIYAKNTGEKVQFVRGEWNFNQQLAMKSLNCSSRIWDDDLQVYNHQRSEDGGVHFSKTYFPYIGGDGVNSSSRDSTDDGPKYYAESSQINDFKLLLNGSFMELTDTGFRMWWSGRSYFSCQISDFAPKRLLPLQPDNCDYSIADQYDGWGWNQAIQQSCPPMVEAVEPVNNCDYTNAELYNGWGWNETTRESCAPVTEMVEQVTAQVPVRCDYSNAALSNGWGWNETTRESCAPLSETVEQVTAQCDYRNAALSNGWGWNETTRESCAPL